LTRFSVGWLRGAVARRLLMRGVAPLIAAAWLLTLAGPVGYAGPAVVQNPPPPDAARFVIVPDASTVTYRVGETFFTGNRFSVAVGTTHAVQGEILVDRAHPANSRIGTVTVDISTFQSDRARRDSAIRERWLESAKFPTAQFTPTAIQGLPASYTDGQEIPVQIIGQLRVRNVTRPTTFTGTIKLAGDTLSGTVQTTVLMTDFGFEPPAILGTLKAENQAQLELRFTARRV
jgi:polyisoprenoid-binding protein YceI